MSENVNYAQALARHVKAALLHLRQAESLAELAGVDIGASAHDVPAAGLIRAAGEVVEDLDLWAINNARVSRAASTDTYRDTGNWCHAEGASPPAGSWPPEPVPDPRTHAATHRRLCAHADQDGEGMHWLEPGETCDRAPATDLLDSPGMEQIRTYLAQVDAGPETRAGMWADLDRRHREREGWEKTVQACVCRPERCIRGEFHDHAGEARGCMVCADLGPDEPCYAVVLRQLRVSEGGSGQ